MQPGGIGKLSLSSYPSKYLVTRGIGGGRPSVFFLAPTSVPESETKVNVLSANVDHKVKSPGNLNAPPPKLSALTVKKSIAKVKSGKNLKPKVPIQLSKAEISELTQPQKLTLPKNKTLASEIKTSKRSGLSFNIIPNRD